MTYVSAHTAVVRRIGRPAGKGAEARFDPTALNPKPGIASSLIAWVLNDPRWLYAILRRCAPILTLGGWAFVTRYEDVEDVLRRDAVFPTPFGPKIEILNDGPNFILGMGNGPEYRQVRGYTAAAFPVADNDAVVGPIAKKEAETLVADSRGRLDAVQNLITLVPTRVCEQYYGVPVADEKRFADMTIAMSTFMFGDPTDSPTLRTQALLAGAEFMPIITSAIAAARETPEPADTVLGRLVAMKSPGGEPLTDPVIASIVIGMITGFVPTNTMAAGHMLEMLFRRPDFMGEAAAAAREGDDDWLWKCLWEAFRFLPLNPGPFRVCGEDAVIGAGTPRAKTIKKGTKLCVGTHSAMFDPRRIERPNAFDPSRKADNYMMFGVGLHWCIGAPLAQAQITQTLKPLLAKSNLRRASGPAGRLTLEGPFPAHLIVEFDPD
jgi:cytochrome P450